MNRDELIREIRFSLPSRRMYENVALGVVELQGELIVLKSRYEKHTTKRIIQERKDFITIDKYHEDMNHDYNELLARHVIYDRRILGRRGLIALIALGEDLKPLEEPIEGFKGLSSCFLPNLFEGFKTGELIELNSYSRAGTSYIKTDHPDLDVDKHKE